MGRVAVLGHSVESDLSDLVLFAAVDGDDGELGGGRWCADLAWGGAGRGGDVGEPAKQGVEGGVPVVDRSAFVVGERAGGEHALQVVLGLEQLGLGGVLGV